MKLVPGELKQILTGQISGEQLKELDLVVLSPGHRSLPVVEKMKAAGIRIWGEVELAYENAKAMFWRSPARTERRQQPAF